MTINRFQGLARGPIDHNASSVINSISNGVIEMGSVVKLNSTITTSEILPRVEETTVATDRPYGIAVGGDADGIYSTTGAASGDDSTRATTGAGQAVVVCTQGRCPARVNGLSPAISIGDILVASANTGILIKPAAGTSQNVIGRALADSDLDGDIIPIDIQREGNVTQS